MYYPNRFHLHKNGLSNEWADGGGKGGGEEGWKTHPKKHGKSDSKLTKSRLYHRLKTV